MRLGDWLSRGPFHLRLSSGFFGFYAHAGVLRALEEAGFFPASLGGSSAGAIAAGMAASGLDGRSLEAQLRGFTREDFWDPGVGFGLLRGRKLRALLRERAPVARIEECPVPLAVSVFDLATRRTRVVRQGPLATAIQASAALPGLFQPVWLEGRPCLDGGILDRTSLATAPPPGTRLLFHHLLPSKTWHRKTAAVHQPPSRAGMLRLSIEGLPRLGPNRLQRGLEVYNLARRATAQALDLPHSDVMLCRP